MMQGAGVRGAKPRSQRVGCSGSRFPPSEFSQSGLLDLLNALLYDLVDETELSGAFGGEKLVTFQCLFDLLDRLAGVPDVDFIQALANVQDFLSMDHDVASLPLEAAGRLMNHDAGIWQRKPHVLVAGGQQ